MNSWNCLAYSFLRIILSPSFSLPSLMEFHSTYAQTVFSQRFKETPMKISGAISLCSSLSSTMPLVAMQQILVTLASLRSDLLSSVRFHFLVLPSRKCIHWKVKVLVGLTSFISLFSGIKMLHSLWPNVWKQLFHIFCASFQLFMAGRQIPQEIAFRSGSRSPQNAYYKNMQEKYSHRQKDLKDGELRELYCNIFGKHLWSR